MRLETLKNEAVSGSKLSTLACVTVLVEDEFSSAGYGSAHACTQTVLPVRKKGNWEIVEGARYRGNQLLLLNGAGCSQLPFGLLE